MSDSTLPPTRRLVYVSGAPRVSTRDDAEATGPRSHVLGVMDAFRTHGWDVTPFIVGDRVPVAWTDRRGERALRGSPIARLGADVTRLWLGWRNGGLALRETLPAGFRRQGGEQQGLGQPWVYERYASFQSLGLGFQRRGVPWILETNALLFHEATGDRRAVVLRRLARAAEIRAYHACDVLVCVSERLRDLVVRETGVDAGKVLVIPNGVDTTRFDSEPFTSGRAAPRRMLDRPTLGFVGSLAPWQALDRLLYALQAVAREGAVYGLVIVGDGPERARLEELSRTLGLTGRVKFTGRVDPRDVPAYLAGVDLAYSGPKPLAAGEMYLSPLKLYEYLAMGRPVLAAAFDDARRAVRPGHNGYLFSPDGDESLVRALLDAWSDRHRWPELGRHAREEAVRHHSWEARVRDLVSGVERLLEERRVRS